MSLIKLILIFDNEIDIDIEIVMKLIFYIAALRPLWNSCYSNQQLGKPFVSSPRRSVSCDLHLVRVKKILSAFCNVTIDQCRST